MLPIERVRLTSAFINAHCFQGVRGRPAERVELLLAGVAVCARGQSLVVSPACRKALASELASEPPKGWRWAGAPGSRRGKRDENVAGG